MSLDDFCSSTADECPNPPFREWPLISCVVATYERPKHLRRALDSILAQTFQDMEVWVIHDGLPSEDTTEVYGEYSEKFEAAGIDFFPIWIDEHTGYYCTPRNVVTENCRGAYVANLDDDNEWLPDALASLVEAMEEGETWPDIVYGRRTYVVDEGAPEYHKDLKVADMAGDSPFVPWDAVAHVRLAGNQPNYNFIDSSDFLAAKGALYRLGLRMGHIWDDSRRRYGDFYLMSDGLLAADWRFKGIDKIVQRYHIDGSNLQLLRSPSEVPTEKLL